VSYFNQCFTESNLVFAAAELSNQSRQPVFALTMKQCRKLPLGFIGLLNNSGTEMLLSFARDGPRQQDITLPPSAPPPPPRPPPVPGH